MTKQSNNKTITTIISLIFILILVITGLILFLSSSKKNNRSIILFVGLFVLAFVITCGIIIFTKSFQLISQAKINDRIADDNSNTYYVNSSVLLNNLAQGIIVVAGNTIKIFNDTAIQITGHSQEEAHGMTYNTVFELINHDGSLIAENENPIVQAVFSKQNKEGRAFIKNATGGIVPIHLTVTNFMNNLDSTVMISFRNISQELEKEREQLEFISTASHEMRTPIASIDGYLGLALNPKICQIDGKAQEYLQKAQLSVRHLGELFKNLLIISKADDDGLIINKKVIDLNQIAMAACDDFRQLALSKNITLTFVPQQSNLKTIVPDFFVYTDPALLREVFDNLIDNALKYTEKGSVNIDLKLDLKQETVIISVADTGIGIPEKDLKYLFQKFYRVDNSATREIGGTGLGLYLVRRIVENMQGRVYVTSVFGQGSTFFVELPYINKAKADKFKKQEILARNQLVTLPESAQQYQLPEKNQSAPMSNYHSSGQPDPNQLNSNYRQN